MLKKDALFKSELVKLLPRLYRYARVLTPSRFDADDLLQMTCERALTRWHQFNLGSPMDRWAFTIMSSVWKNELRSRAIRQGQGFVSLESDELAITDHAEGNIFLAEVLKGVMALPENQRETMLLVYVEGYSYQQAADIIGTPVGTVMSRLARARLALKDTMNSEQPVPNLKDREKKT